MNNYCCLPGDALGKQYEDSGALPRVPRGAEHWHERRCGSVHCRWVLGLPQVRSRHQGQHYPQPP